MRLRLLSRTNNNLTAGRCYLCKNSLGASFPKGVFIRNPTETDEEIFTCIQPLPISLQPVLAQLCSFPEVLSPRFPPSQSIQRQSLFMF